MDDEKLIFFLIAAAIVLGILSGGGFFRTIGVNPLSGPNLIPQQVTNSAPGRGGGSGGAGGSSSGAGGGIGSGGYSNFGSGPITSGTPSPFVGQVRISSVTSPETLNEFVTLYSSGSARVNITGWSLRSILTGSVVTIGQATSLPGLLPLAPVVTSGDTIIVAASEGPMGASFQVNKCMGYLSQERGFLPRLSRACPSPYNELPPLSDRISNSCLDFIQRMPYCKAFAPNDFPEDLLTTECEQYITKQFNYNNCVTVHRNDTDFLSREWRMHEGRTRLLWLKKRDQIQLVDSQGRVVDEYTYNY